MDIFKEYKELKTNVEFKKFLRDNKEYYLVHVLVPEDTQRVEFGFYNDKKDRIVVFETNPIRKGEEEEVFKEGKTITKLDINKIKINYEEAMNEVKKIMTKEFSEEKPKKKIIILQRINEPVWNVTLVCESLNIINIRVNAETGKITRKNKTSLLNMTGVAK